MNGEGFTFLEVVGTCPTNWGMTPVEASEFAKNEMVKTYPLGIKKDVKRSETDDAQRSRSWFWGPRRHAARANLGNWQQLRSS